MKLDRSFKNVIPRNAVVLAVAATVYASHLTAQPASNGRAVLEEVMVTARRTEETLQTTPVAVTALSTEAIDIAQIVDVADLERAAPNLTISTGAPATPGFANITMRGQTNMNANTASDPAVGLYVDGVYLARSAGSLLDLEDVARVEVLRGPQGTLFGRSTTGGAINIVTQQPKNEFEAKLAAEVGNYNHRSFRGMVNVPLVDERLAARLNYRYLDREGYGENVVLDHDLNDMQDNHFFRGQLKYSDPSGKWDLTLAGDYNEFETGGQIMAMAGVNPTAPFAAIPGIVPALQSIVQTGSSWYDNYGQELTSTHPGFYPGEAFEQFGYSAHLNVDLGEVEMESITAYRELDTVGSNDLDGTPVNIIYSLTAYQQDQVSQEFKFTGDIGDRFNWIGGLYYFKETGTESSIAQAFGVFGAPVFENLGDIESTSKALYGQINYKFTDALRLTLGYRKTWDERIAVIKNTNPLLPVAVCAAPPSQRDDGVSCNTTREVKFDYPAWVVGLDYQFSENIFLYASTSAASMSGGWNLRVGSAPAFEPEENQAMEVGVKADWLDRRLRTNLAVFRNKPQDVQRVINTVFDVGFGPQSTAFVQNAGDVEVTGAELEITALPWEGMTVTTAIGYTDAQYESFTEVQRVNAPTTTIGCVPAPGAGVGTVPPGAADCLVDRSGEAVAATPESTFGIGLTQVVPTGWGELTLHADYTYIDEQQFSPSTAAAQQPAPIQAAYAEAERLNTMDSRGIVNAKIGLDIRDTGVSVALWGRNLTDDQYVARAQDFYTGLGVAVNFVGDPRTYGMTVSYEFD